MRFEFKVGSLIAKLKVLDPAFSQDAERSSPFISDIAVAYPMSTPKDRLGTLDDQWRSFELENAIVNAKCQCTTVLAFFVELHRWPRRAKVRAVAQLYDGPYRTSTLICRRGKSFQPRESNKN